MNFIYTTQPIDDAAAHVATSLRQHLTQGEHVLWLLSGGSGEAIALKAVAQLTNVDFSNLTVSLTDERYGPVGHPDENWQQLLDAGFLVPGATVYRPLQGDDRATTTTKFSAWLAEQLLAADYRLGIFGIGSDGHTGGIKPGTSAVTATEDATSFVGADFERITITFPVIRQLDEIVVQASGSEKAPIIRQLFEGGPSPNDLPSAILLETPNTTLYTDIKQEEQS